MTTRWKFYVAKMGRTGLSITQRVLASIGLIPDLPALGVNISALLGQWCNALTSMPQYLSAMICMVYCLLGYWPPSSGDRWYIIVMILQIDIRRWQ